jgi:hypothetical protein
MAQNLTTLILGTAILSALNGCDDRVTQVAREAASRQAQQNTEMAKLHQEVATGARELVAADAKARDDMLGVHHDLQSERAQLDSGWNALEIERRQTASERRTESILVSLFPVIGGTAVVILLLGFCWYAVGAAHTSEDSDFRLEEYLVCEILPDEPRVLDGVVDVERRFGPAGTDHSLS